MRNAIGIHGSSRHAALVSPAAALEHAKRTLQNLDIEANQVLAVDIDSIFYLDDNGKPRTAWLERTDGKLHARTETGFQAEPRSHS